MSSAPTPEFSKRSVAVIPAVIQRGWRMFLRTRPLSVSFSMIFAVIGIAIMTSILSAKYAPLVFPASGIFMLVGPFLLAGFFAVADRYNQGQESRFADIRAGFKRSSGAIMAVALICTLPFVLWIVNAGYLYAKLFGHNPETIYSLLAPTENMIVFLGWNALVGSLLGLFVFAVSAFSVPLLYYRRAYLTQAILLSVKAVFGNFMLCIVWALILALTIIVSILIFPLFLLTFPVLAFASHSLYREVFPG